MIYDFVPFHVVAEELARNADQHNKDIRLKEWYGEGNLDWDTYLQLSLAGRCRVVTLRDENKLIAYSVFFITNNLNHKTFIQAVNTGLFIEKKYRGRITLEFIRKSSEYLKEWGVHEDTYNFNDIRIGKLLERAGYKINTIAWSKRYVLVNPST